MYILLERLNNDKIEHYVSVTRYITGSNQHLDCASYLYDKKSLLLKYLYDYCRNSNSSHNRKVLIHY